MSILMILSFGCLQFSGSKQFCPQLKKGLPNKNGITKQTNKSEKIKKILIVDGPFLVDYGIFR